MATKTIPVDKIYKLVTSTPLSFTLPSRNTRQFPLLWYDEVNNLNRTLRYASNQKSPFEDEQDENVIVEPIIFENGFLRVAKNNPALQMFLFYHPMNGTTFVEVNYEKDAAKEMEVLNNEVDALIEARRLSIDQIETVARVLFGKDPSRISTAELKRDILVYAKNDPTGFMHLINDPMLSLNSNVHRFFDAKLLSFRNGQKEVWFNTTSNKKKMLSVPFGEDPFLCVAQYLQTDEGIDALKLLENNL